MSKDASDRLLAGVLVVHNRAMEEVRFYYDRKKAGLMLFYGVLGLYVGVMNVLVPIFRPKGFPEFRIFIGIVMIFATSYILWAAWLKLSRKDAVLKVNSEGVTDNDPVDGRGFVPWSQVQKIDCFADGAFKLILEPGASKNPPGILSALRGQNLRHRQIRIFSVEIKDISIEKAARVRALMISAHDAQPPG